MQTINPKPRRTQSERRDLEPFTVFVRAVDRGTEVRLRRIKADGTDRPA